MCTFNAPYAVEKARAKFPCVEAVDPDLRAFQRRGGKLLLYHGWADAVVPPEYTVGYYERVKQFVGACNRILRSAVHGSWHEALRRRVRGNNL
ncbi:MAG: tannase/feruloyl esterase family alpha/beta hydrolase [Acidobacteria bacterium]|nr:tannase/feruloyl esterase family alpha/beta hydrolase [Acidobacteriota bacterium]